MENGEILNHLNDWLKAAVECVAYLLLERESQIQSQPKPRLSELRAFVLFLNRPRYRGADKSLARPTSRCILFDGENISFDGSLVIQWC